MSIKTTLLWYGKGSRLGYESACLQIVSNYLNKMSDEEQSPAHTYHKEENVCQNQMWWRRHVCYLRVKLYPFTDTVHTGQHLISYFSCWLGNSGSLGLELAPESCKTQKCGCNSIDLACIIICSCQGSKECCIMHIMQAKKEIDDEDDSLFLIAD